MIRRLIAGLVVVLAIQVALVVVVYGRRGQATAATVGPWVRIDGAALQKVAITNGKGDSVALQRVHGAWVVPAKSDFPANQDQLQVIVHDLDAARPDLPVATSGDAQARFHVARHQFERRIVFVTRGNRKTTVYLGKTAGAGRVYARLVGSPDVENIRFPLWRASTRVASWLDPEFLQFPLATQRRIELPHVTLVQADGVWKPTGLAAGEQPASGKIQTLLNGLSAMQWTRVDGTTQRVHVPQQATFTVAVTPQHGTAVTYRFYETAAVPGKQSRSAGHAKAAQKSAAKPEWKVTRSGSDFVVSVAAATVDPLRTATLASLSKPAAHATEAAKTAVAKGSSNGLRAAKPAAPSDAAG